MTFPSLHIWKMKCSVIYPIILWHCTGWLNGGEINNSPRAGENALNPLAHHDSGGILPSISHTSMDLMAPLFISSLMCFIHHKIAINYYKAISKEFSKPKLHLLVELISFDKSNLRNWKLSLVLCNFLALTTYKLILRARKDKCIVEWWLTLAVLFLNLLGSFRN